MSEARKYGYSDLPDARIGENPYEHLYLLVETRDRTKAIHTLLQQHIKPGSSFLDLGCGSLGVMSIIASKLGATRIVGVDHGNIETANIVAKENGVTNVQWIQSRVEDLDLHGERFDVISGTIWLDAPWDNQPISVMFNNAVQKFGRPDSVIIPNRVGFSATGMGFNIDEQGLDEDIVTSEQDTGLTLDLLRRNRNSYSYKKFLISSRTPRIIGTDAKVFTNVEPLTTTTDVISIDYQSRNPELTFPTSIQLKVAKEGFLTSIHWSQQNSFKDVVDELRKNEPIRLIGIQSEISNPRQVVVGDVITVNIPDISRWQQTNGTISIS